MVPFVSPKLSELIEMAEKRLGLVGTWLVRVLLIVLLLVGIVWGGNYVVATAILPLAEWVKHELSPPKPTLPIVRSSSPSNPMTSASAPSPSPPKHRPHTSGFGERSAPVCPNGICASGNMSGSQTVNNYGPPRAQNGFYQDDTQVGQAEGATRSADGQTISFQLATFTAHPDPDQPIEFHGFRILCPAVPPRSRDISITSTSLNFVGLTCQMVGTAPN